MHLTPQEIRRRFRERGLKVTPQRAAIYQALAETSRHPTADDLYRQVKRLHPMISQNTVYYSLSALQAAGLVREVNYWHDRARFDANMAAHHHLICLECRRIQDMADKTLDRLTIARGRNTGFEVVGHRVEFYGYCANCRRRRPRREGHRRATMEKSQ
jgi:Fur family peroxide stress response transcriptional regulator